MNDWVKGRIVGKTQWNQRLYTLHIEALIGSFRAGQFTRVALDLGEERVGRPYSFVNAPNERPLEIYFNEVPNGPLTPRLSRLEKGDMLWVAEQARGVFTMDQVPNYRDLWLIATGTGLGVYLSILRTEEPWQRFERVILVHGVRNADELTYSDTLNELREQQGHRFKYAPVLSREQRPHTLHGRIPGLVEGGELERHVGSQISSEHSHLMLCGNSGMIKEMRRILDSRGMRRHRRDQPGHYTTEQYH
jgi:ferredoxin--NADP+ reductase